MKPGEAARRRPARGEEEQTGRRARDAERSVGKSKVSELPMNLPAPPPAPDAPAPPHCARTLTLPTLGLRINTYNYSASWLLLSGHLFSRQTETKRATWGYFFFLFFLHFHFRLFRLEIIQCGRRGETHWLLCTLTWHNKYTVIRVSPRDKYSIEYIVMYMYIICTYVTILHTAHVLNTTHVKHYGNTRNGLERR